MRSIWKGHIRFLLVAIPVRIYNAIETSEKIQFNQLHRDDFGPIGYDKRCKKCNEVVSNDQITKGYQYEPDRYAIIEPDDIARIKIKTTRAVDIVGFEGVVNTTTNHIITALEAGASFEDALARMQAEGIAEADPSLDVDGWDAAAKTAALANVLMGARITPHDVLRTGLDAGTGEAARDAIRRGMRLKLVASASRKAGGPLVCTVAPRELPADHLLATLDGGANALILETDILDRIAIGQMAGGLTQTAYGLLTDIVTIARGARS
jgi:homoserine dehydrogenase